MHYMRVYVLGYSDPTTPTVRDKRPFIEKEDYLLVPLGVEAKQGYAKIDKKFRYLEEKKWSKDIMGYASEGKIRLHSLIMGKRPEGLEVDHINRDKLDNRQINLRFVTRSQNSINRGLMSTNKSGYTGVHFSKTLNKWTSQIKRNKHKTKHLGMFKTAKQAYQARMAAEQLLDSPSSNRRCSDCNAYIETMSVHDHILIHQELGI